MEKYVIGIDYGTLSARAVLVNTADGKELAEAEFVYPHAVMDKALPDGTELEGSAAFQHPQDYLDALSFTVKEIVKISGVSSNEIVGIGIDFTACTVLPIDKNGIPLCFDEKFKSQPHAYVKLWKHHTAQDEADEITALAAKRKEEWLDIYGGKVSSEWFFPKILETLHKAPEIYAAADRFIEAGDWLTLMLTGEDVRSSCMAGYKGMWNAKSGYPSKEFFKDLAPELENIIGTKVSPNIKPTGSKAGEISKQGSELTGLLKGTAVAVPIIDAHAAMPALGISGSGKLMLIVGTSGCHIILDKKDVSVQGICGRVKDGIIPDFVAYEAGQACVGDVFDWFIKNNVPAAYTEAANAEGKRIFAYLTEKAQALEVGESGLIALEWWNGNRTPYVDYDLKGAIFGYTLKTKPEEIYRALIEATAFGTKQIVDLYAQNGIEINEIYCAGGIPQKDAFLTQIYADVLGKTVVVPKTKQAGAMGSAIFAAYASGVYDSVENAVKNMVNAQKKVYKPIYENTEKYKSIYNKYVELGKLFAKDKPELLK